MNAFCISICNDGDIAGHHEIHITDRSDPDAACYLVRDIAGHLYIAVDGNAVLISVIAILNINAFISVRTDIAIHIHRRRAGARPVFPALYIDSPVQGIDRSGRDCNTASVIFNSYSVTHGRDGLRFSTDGSAATFDINTGIVSRNRIQISSNTSARTLDMNSTGTALDGPRFCVDTSAVVHDNKAVVIGIDCICFGGNISAVAVDFEAIASGNNAL